MRKCISIMVVFALFVSFAPASYAANPRQNQVILTEESPNRLGYYEYLPIGYETNPSELWPVVIFLHGAGETGDGDADLADVLLHGPPKNIDNGMNYPFITISPQSPGWWNVGVLDDFVEYILDTYRIDTDRVYMTGLSMGGGGTWSYAAAHAEKLAAIVPVAAANTNPNGNPLVELPTWAFHSWGDTTVSADESVSWINDIAGAVINSGPTDMIANYPGTYTGPPGKHQTSDMTRTANFYPTNGWVWEDGVDKTAGSQPSLTLYPDTSHNSWARTYDNQLMWDWLLAQDRDTNGPVEDLQIITPVAAGAATAGGYFPLNHAFDAQPTLIVDQPIGGSGGIDAPFYANRYGYIDFGPDWHNVRITSTWTKYRTWSLGNQSPYAELWWDNDKDTINDSGLNETSINFNTASSLSTGTTEPWIRDLDSSLNPITPEGRYLVIHAATPMTNRAKEYAIIGWIAQ